MATDTTTNPIEEAEHCLRLAQAEDDQARMGRFVEMAHAWLDVARLRALS